VTQVSARTSVSAMGRRDRRPPLEPEMSLIGSGFVATDVTVCAVDGEGAA
jgi:hypothetical protein